MCYSKAILKTQATIHPGETNFLERSANQASFYVLRGWFPKKKTIKESQHQKNLWINRKSK